MSSPRGVGLGAVVLAIASLVSVPPIDPASKLDRALREWMRRPTTTMRVLVRTRPGAAGRVQHDLERLASGSVLGSISPDIVVARVDAGALRAVAARRDVERVSSDALVRTLGSVLSEDVLVNTGSFSPGMPFLRKPLRPDALAAGVRETLDSPVLLPFNPR